MVAETEDDHESEWAAKRPVATLLRVWHAGDGAQVVPAGPGGHGSTHGYREPRQLREHCGPTGQPAGRSPPRFAETQVACNLYLKSPFETGVLHGRHGDAGTS
jgi:hypothetical protein